MKMHEKVADILDWYRKPHFTRLHCRACGWVSAEQIGVQMADRGIPWYCDNCGKRPVDFITYTDEERYEAIAQWANRIIRWTEILAEEWG